MTDAELRHRERVLSLFTQCERCNAVARKLGHICHTPPDRVSVAFARDATRIARTSSSAAVTDLKGGGSCFI